MDGARFELEALRSQNEEYTEIIGRLHNENERLLSLSSSSEAKLSNLELEKNYMKHVINDIKDTMYKLKAQQNSLKTLFERTLQGIELDMNKIKSDVVGTISTVTFGNSSELLNLRSKIIEFNAEIQELRGNNKKLIDEGSLERATMNEALISMTEQKTQLSQEVDVLRGNLARLTRELIATKSEVGECRSKESTYDQSKAALNTKISELMGKLQEAQSESDKEQLRYKEELDDVKDQLSKLVVKMKQSEANAQALLIELQNERQKHKQLKDSLSSSDRLGYSADDLEQAVGKRMKEMQVEFDKMQELLELSEQEKDILNSNIQMLSEEVRQLTVKNNTLEDQLGGMKTRCSSLESGVTSLEAKVKADGVTISQQSAAIKKLTDETLKLETQNKALREAQAKAPPLSAQCTNCARNEMEVAVLRKTVKAECTERADLLRTLGQYKQKIEELEAQLTTGRGGGYEGGAQYGVGVRRAAREISGTGQQLKRK